LLLLYRQTLIISYYFSKYSNAEKIDTIAWASVEKMAHLSFEIKHINEYLIESYKEIITDSDSDEDYAVLKLLFKHKIKDISELLLHLSSSNETLRSDWLGVVSLKTKEEIAHTYEKLNDYLGNWKMLEFFNNQTNVNVDESEKISEIIKNMENIEKEINFIPKSNFYYRNGPAVRVSQDIKTNDNGILTIEVLRETYIATGSGKIKPEYQNIPIVNTKLISCPLGANIDDDFTINPGCGTRFDFNITLKSIKKNKYLFIGKYEIEYLLKNSYE
jgi:hypothetical protein